MYMKSLESRNEGWNTPTLFLLWCNMCDVTCVKAEKIAEQEFTYLLWPMFIIIIYLNDFPYTGTLPL